VVGKGGCEYVLLLRSSQTKDQDRTLLSFGLLGGPDRE